MSRFDDELRGAAAPIAREPLPDGVLDEALDAAPARRRWPVAAGAITAALVLAIAAGIGFGELLPSPSPSASPSAAPSGSPLGSCTHIVAPAGGGDIVTVFFPCGVPDGLEMAGGTRSVARNLDADERLDAALRAFLDGPTELERSAGMSAVAPTGSADLLTSVTVWADGLAQIDFAPAIGDLDALSERSRTDTFTRALRATALHFAEVTALELQIDGSCEDFFALFGGACEHLAEPVAWAGDCPIIAPLELPSGAPLTAARPYPGTDSVSWGSGSDTVTEDWSDQFGGGGMPAGPEDPVTVHGHAGSVSGPADEQSQAVITWRQDGDVIFGTSERADCWYSMFLGPGIGHEQAIAFAGKVGSAEARPAPTPSASLPPAEPVANSIEDQGIRLTLTLERDRISFGDRTWADVTVENIGADIVYWGHSGTCVFAAGVTAFPDLPEEVPYGRDDWPGDSGILKTITVDSRAFPGHGFTPEGWVDFEGNVGCTSDLQISEINPGEVVTYRAAWDGDAPYGRPATPGSYRVDATFNYMSRGAPPAGDLGTAENAVIVSVPMNVDGAAIGYLAPGEAVDRILEDPSFQAHLADAPRRGRWLESALTFQDGSWVLSLYLEGPTEAIVATVDAVSGEVIGVEIDPNPDRPGDG